MRNNWMTLFRRWAGLIIGAVLFFATCYMLYFVQYRMYGGTVKTSLLYVAIFVPVAFISWLLQERPPKEPALEAAGDSDGTQVSVDAEDKGDGRRTGLRRVWKLISSIILVACTVFMVYALIKNPYYLIIYHYFGLLIVLGILYAISRRHPKMPVYPKISVSASLMLLTIMAVTAAFCLIAPLTTVNGAGRIMEDAGFSSVEYRGVLSNRMAVDLAFNGDVHYEREDTDRLGFYLLCGEKDGEEYGGAVSVVDGQLVGFDRTDGNDSLSFYLSYVK